MLLAGYLGYTSGLSLTCMLFFLISVSLRERFEEVEREFGALGHSLPYNLISPSFLPQVIYKKFHSSCDVGHNETASESKSLPVLPIQGLNRSCEAKMFTMDSQVGMQAHRACSTLRLSGAMYWTLGASNYLI